MVYQIFPGAIIYLLPEYNSVSPNYPTQFSIPQGMGVLSLYKYYRLKYLDNPLDYGFIDQFIQEGSSSIFRGAGFVNIWN